MQDDDYAMCQSALPAQIIILADIAHCELRQALEIEIPQEVRDLILRSQASIREMSKIAAAAAASREEAQQ